MQLGPRAVLLGGLLAGLLAALTAGPVTAQDAPPPPTRWPSCGRSHTAKAARDADALVAVFAEGAEISGCACPTPEAVRATYQRGLFARDVVFEYANLRVAGDAVTYEYRIYEGDQKAQGIPPREGTEVDTVRDGKIVAAIMHPDPASAARQDAALRALRARQAAAAATATHVARSGLLRDLPSTQDRGSPSVGPWVLATAAALLGVLLLAAVRRSPER